MKRSLSLLLLALVGAAHAQYAVVPKAYTNSPASTSGINTFISTKNNPRTGQMLINSNQLGSISVGSLITGLTFRLYTKSTVAYPPSDATWANYNILMGESVAPTNASAEGTFADNFVGTPTLVRSGALTIPAKSFAASGVSTQANAWGFEIKFQQAYVYTGGNLGIEITQSGSNITTGGFLEVATTSDAGYQAGDYSYYYTSGYQATTGGSRDTMPVTRLSVTPVPEPGTMAALGFGALAMLRRRRKSA